MECRWILWSSRSRGERISFQGSPADLCLDLDLVLDLDLDLDESWLGRIQMVQVQDQVQVIDRLCNGLCRPPLHGNGFETTMLYCRHLGCRD